MNGKMKKRIFDSFFSLGSVNPSVWQTYKVDVKKRLINSDNSVIIQVPSLSENLGECFDDVDSIMFSAGKELVHG
jgi:hypothetical protein